MAPLLSHEVHVRLGACENRERALFLEITGKGEEVCPPAQVGKADDRPAIPEVIIKGFLEEVLVIFPCDGHDGTVIGRVILNNARGQLGAEEAIAFTLNIACQNGHPLSSHLEQDLSYTLLTSLTYPFVLRYLRTNVPTDHGEVSNHDQELISNHLGGHWPQVSQ